MTALNLQVNGLDLTDDERAAALAMAERLQATVMSLYRTSTGLYAFVIGSVGEQHLGVPIVKEKA